MHETALKSSPRTLSHLKVAVGSLLISVNNNRSDPQQHLLFQPKWGTPHYSWAAGKYLLQKFIYLFLEHCREQFCSIFTWYFKIIQWQYFENNSQCYEKCLYPLYIFLGWTSEIYILTYQQSLVRKDIRWVMKHTLERIFSIWFPDTKKSLCVYVHNSVVRISVGIKQWLPTPLLN